MAKDNLEGRDVAFGSALEYITEAVNTEDTNEAAVKKGGVVNDPLKAAKPADLSKEGEKDMKLKQMDAMGADVKSHAKEGIEPDDQKDNEDTKIQKLTETLTKLMEDENLSQEVTALISKAKEALDKGEYDAARGYCDRLEQVQMAVSEPKVEVPEPDMHEEEEELETPEEEFEEHELGEELPNESREETSDPFDGYEEFIMNDELQESIDRILDEGIDDDLLNEAGKKHKHNPNAKLRNRGDVVFPADSPKVTDDKDHFPLNSEKQARNALARANQYSKAPKWYKGSLTDLVKKVASAVKRKYKSIKVSKAAETPGKG